jgi:hypothetical protein
MMLLAAMSSSAAAKWARVAADETSTAYADSATIRRSGNMARMWSVFDHKTAVALDNGKQYLSTRAQLEYDCKEERMRGVAVSFHSKNMARGELVHSDLDPGSWGPVPPGTVNDALWKIACRKR